MKLFQGAGRIEMSVMAILLCVGVMHFVLQSAVLLRGTAFVTSTITIDDTYYYLETAWNTKQLGFVTFDGIHETNGVQFLWFWMLVMIASVVPTKVALLNVSLLMAYLLNVACYGAMWRIAARSGRPFMALFMAAFWLVQSLGGQVYSSGMESSLHGCVFWWMIAAAVSFSLIKPGMSFAGSLLSLTVLLVLNAWARLDSGIWSAVIYCFCVARAINRGVIILAVRRHLSWILFSAMLAVIGVVVAVAF